MLGGGVWIVDGVGAPDDWSVRARLATICDRVVGGAWSRWPVPASGSSDPGEATSDRDRTRMVSRGPIGRVVNGLETRSSGVRCERPCSVVRFATDCLSSTVPVLGARVWLVRPGEGRATGVGGEWSVGWPPIEVLCVCARFDDFRQSFDRARCRWSVPESVLHPPVGNLSWG